MLCTAWLTSCAIGSRRVCDADHMFSVQFGADGPGCLAVLFPDVLPPVLHGCAGTFIGNVPVLPVA